MFFDQALKPTTGLFFSVIDRTLSHFGQNVWKHRLKTLLWRVLIQLLDKQPKSVSDQNVSGKMTEMFQRKKNSYWEQL